jgi:hypothetical protein
MSTHKENENRSSFDVAVQKRLNEARMTGVPWKKWGPYLSERQWGTVREDYSTDGNAWSYFPHDHSRSRAYRWGEDGLGGISDHKQRLCFALALWNERDPILKERLFGLTNSEGNHGEDVKEYYFYLDSTPTHDYMKYLYKYPQCAYPYPDLVETNARRSRNDFEYELLDTGVFEDNRYFDVFLEYAKETPDDILIRVTVHNRGPEPARLHVLPTLWFRNIWSWKQDEPKPALRAAKGVIHASHSELGNYFLFCEGDPELIFTENESNTERLYGVANQSPWVKDAFHQYVVNGNTGALNPAMTGTKAAAHYLLDLPAGGSSVVRLRLSANPKAKAFGKPFETTFAARLAEADEFYNRITASLNEDQRLVHRQALAGMLWTKQFYLFDVDLWLKEHEAHPLLGEMKNKVRNAEWFHMFNGDIISMPDKWEYPWYAAWDLAFHTIALSLVDFDFAKEQLLLMLRSLYCHPNGQIPAYEWNFSDVNPPVHAWATLYLYKLERGLGREDIKFLERSFRGLMLNFNWWVNRKDPDGRNVFSGGFLGLDNIGVFDRSASLPTGGSLEQADGTAWMAFYCQNMLEISLILADLNPDEYEDYAFNFLQHFIWIAYAMNRIGEHEDEMWDEADGFFYDVLRLPDGSGMRLKIRSMVGLLPLCASTVFGPDHAARHPRLAELVQLFRERHPEVLAHIAPTGEGYIGHAGRRLLSPLSKKRLERVLGYLLDENEFLSPYGIRSLSRYHQDHPFVFDFGGEQYRVSYLPAESDTGMFGGNSNWRGPIWMPVNTLIVRGLLNLYAFYGDDFKVECPVRSGKKMTLYEVAREITQRLGKIFTRNENGQRPVYGGTRTFQEDEHWRDLVLFYEYFHGDNGAGLGASHQTGWTGCIAALEDFFDRVTANDVLAAEKEYLAERLVQEQAYGQALR